MPAHNHEDHDVFREDCFVCRWNRDHAPGGTRYEGTEGSEEDDDGD